MKLSKCIMIIILASFSIMLSVLYPNINNIKLLFLVSLFLIIITNISLKILNFNSLKYLMLLLLYCISPVVAFFSYKEGIDLDIKLAIIYFILFLINYISTKNIIKIFILNLNTLMVIALSNRLETLLYIKNISGGETNGVGNALLIIEIMVGLIISASTILLKRKTNS